MNQRRDIEVSLSDARSVYLLIGECCELGKDPKAWRQRLAQGICELMNTPVSANGVWIVSDGRPVPRLDMYITHQNRPDLVAKLNDGTFKPTETGKPVHNPLAVAAFPALPGVIKVNTRSDFMSDEQWYQCPYYKLVQKPLGLDDTMGGTFFSDNGNAELITTIQDERAPFDQRQVNMFRLLVTEVALQLGKRLSYIEGPSFLDLSSQTMRVLYHLLNGDSEKQIAGRMEISQHTVHEHTKKLHQRYEVSSRGELLGKFMAQAALDMLRDSVDDDTERAANSVG